MHARVMTLSVGVGVEKWFLEGVGGFGLGYLVLCCAERKACYGGVVFEDIGVVFVLLLGV